MEDRKSRCSRRKFLASAAALTFTGGLPASAAAALVSDTTHARPQRPASAGRKPIAVVATVCRPLSFASLLTARFLHGYPRDGRLHVPAQQVAAVHVEQTPENDEARALGREFGFRVTRSVADALTAGTGKLAVEGVLLLAEHGNYPRNERGQILYPRHELFRQVVEVFRRVGRAVPVYHAKHLSHSMAQAREMAAWSRELGCVVMAGSCVPLTERRPALELPAGAPVEEALVVAHGPLEVAGFDALDGLQALLERRRGGETGVVAVTCLTGQAVWKAGDAGLWSWELLDAALARSETAALGDVRRNVGRLAVGGMPQAPASAILVEYRDGTRGAVLLLNGHVQDFTFAARLRDAAPVSCLFHQPPLPGARAFDALAWHVERFLATSQAPAPLERTLLTTGVLEAAMESHARRGERVAMAGVGFEYGL